MRPTDDVVADLKARGLLHQATFDAGDDWLTRESVTAYAGFDPTADSLHIGHLLPALGLARLQKAGHVPIAVVGGGTGLIGDPSGKATERPMLTRDEIRENTRAIGRQLERLLDFAGPRAARIVDNADWLCELNLIGFLRDIGKHFSVNAMVQRDSVQLRLSSRDQGISFTEFTYALLQAYDFLELHDRYGCRLQIGGSDQWGNILDGRDLIGSLRGVEAHGLTQVLVTRADGTKFGKSESGNIWLDPKRTSPYRFHQFWLNVDDADVARYLRYFTFLPTDAISAIEARHLAEPSRREAQRALADDVTARIHGTEALESAKRTAAILFEGGDLRELSAAELEEGLSEAPRASAPRGRLGTPELDLPSALVLCGLVKSKSEARTHIQNGAVAVNQQVVQDPKRLLGAADLLAGRFVVLRRGKKNYSLIELAD
jgi:tyrosyl-tRNA synthetase